MIGKKYRVFLTADCGHYAGTATYEDKQEAIDQCNIWHNQFPYPSVAEVLEFQEQRVSIFSRKNGKVIYSTGGAL